MPDNLPDNLREYIRTKDKDLADKADNFWRISRPILDKQSSPNSNENGFTHVKMVERNVWRLINDSGRISDLNLHELFILSCGACCHDFDKGLFDKLPEGVAHGEGSGDYLVQEDRVFLQNFHEAAVIKKIVGLHDLPDGEFQKKLSNIEKKYPLSTCTVNLNRLAVILKTADILHTDSSRISSIGINTSIMNHEQKNKHFARESITGWYIDGSRIIINAMPKTPEHFLAVEGCEKYIKEKEWPAVSDKLSDYEFPNELEFKIDKTVCGELPDKKKACSATDNSEQPGAKYSQDNDVFNVPYRQKGKGVVGRDSALNQLLKQLTESRGTAIGQAASFYGMGGLGKTQLAVEYAYKYKDKYPKGVIWISADQDIDSQLIQIAKKGNWIAPESEHKLILEIAKRRLSTYSDCLIVFDNVDKLDHIKPYLPEADASPHLLLTSRLPVRGFEPIEIDVLSEDDALDLLCLEAGRDFDSLPIDEKNAAKSIVKDLGFLPLAIEIAGAYLKYSKQIAFLKYYFILNQSFTTALPGEFHSSFTSHEPDLKRTLKISESVLEQAPPLKEILDVLTWSGSSFMGLFLLSTILNVPESDLIHPLNLGTMLRIIRKDEAHERYEIHRLLRKVRQEEFVLEQNTTWTETVIDRIGSWFEERREDFSHLSDYEAEVDHLKQWYENAERIACVQSARLLWLQAYPSYHWGKYNKTYDLLKSALDLYEKKSGVDSELKAHIMNDLGTVFQLSGKYQKSLEFKLQALKIRETLLGTDHKETAFSMDNVGTSYYDLDDYPKALELHERALKIYEKQLGYYHRLTAKAMNNTGATYWRLGKHEEALIVQERALEINIKQLGPEHPETAKALTNLGLTYFKISKEQKALELQEQALKICEKQLGSEHPDTASVLNNYGGTYSELGKHQKALELKERALKIWEKQLGPEHPNTITALKNVVFAFLKVRKFSDAYDLLNRFSKILPPNDFENLKAHINIESKNSGFRSPATIQANKKKKKARSKR